MISFKPVRFPVVLVLIGLMSSGLTACPNKSSTKSEAAPIAKVNGRTITQDDLDHALSQIPPQARSLYETPAAKKDLIDRLVTREVLIQAAEKEGLDKDPTIVERIRTLREGLMLEAYLRKAVEQKTAVTDADVKSYYDANPGARRTPDEVRAKHILVKTEEEAKKVQDEIKAGKKFEDLAKEVSEDPGSKNRGGDLGVLRHGQTVPEFDKVLFELKPGETSGIVKTQFGFHIIRLESRTEGKPLTLEQAKENLRQQLVRDKEKKGFDDLVAELKNKAKIKVY